MRPLVNRLRHLGIEVWIDENEIEDVAAVTAAIQEGLAQSKGVRTLITVDEPPGIAPKA